MASSSEPCACTNSSSGTSAFFSRLSIFCNNRQKLLHLNSVVEKIASKSRAQVRAALWYVDRRGEDDLAINLGLAKPLHPYQLYIH